MSWLRRSNQQVLLLLLSVLQPCLMWSVLFGNVLAAVGCCVCCLAIGGTLGYTSPAVPSMQNDRETVFLRGMSQGDVAWIGSLAPLGAFFGSLLGSPIVEFLGRRKSLLYVSASAFLASWLLVGLAKSLYMIYAGRFLAGLMIGLSFLACPVYITETATTGLRGTLGSFPQLILVTGILLAYALGAWLQWRLLAMVMGVPIAILQAAVMYFMPESPTWLVRNGRRNEARRALVWLRGAEYDVDQELTFIDQSLAHHQEDGQDCDCADDEEAPIRTRRKNDEGISLKDLKRPNTFIPFAIAMTLMLIQQMSGINAVIFYSVSIFETAGSTLDSNASAVLITAIMCLATGVASFAADRAGRRPLLVVSSTLMAVAMAAMSAYFFFNNEMTNSHNNIKGRGLISSAPVEPLLDIIRWVPLAGLALFLVGFSLGFGPLPWLLATEMLPPKLKAATASVSFGFNWLLVFAITRAFPSLSAELGPAAVFLAFAAICALGCVFTIVLVPETKHKELPEIQEFFVSKCGCCF